MAGVSARPVGCAAAECSADTTQRGSLSVFNQISNIMMTGILVALVFPMVIMPILGVDQGKWIALMSFLSILALPLTLLERSSFTRSRRRSSRAGRSNDAGSEAENRTSF